MESLKNVTAVLITKRPVYPEEIRLDGFGEVIIRTDSPNVYERYAQAQNARNDIVYVQDDDCIVDYRELFKHYNGRITNSIARGRRRYYSDISGGMITLVGWGAFFPKSMLSSFRRYTDKYGRDFHFLREADRIFTWLNHPHNTIVFPHRDLDHCDSADRLHAESKHFEYLDEVIAKLNAIEPRRDSPLQVLRNVGKHVRRLRAYGRKVMSFPVRRWTLP